MAYTEFACRSGGSNMNGGAIASNGEPATSPVYSSTNGNWNGTATFTPTDGSTPLGLAAAGDWAHVFVDGSTTPVYIARVTNVAAGVNGVITLSTTAKAGSAPTSSATGRSINIGGAWLGPNGASGFPFTLLTSVLQNVGSDRPRCNFKNDQTYNITAAITVSGTGPIIFQGYTTTFGDLGKATIDGGTSGASYTLLNVSNTSGQSFCDLIFGNNGATGSALGVQCSNTNSTASFKRCVVHDVRGHGFVGGSNLYTKWIECEVYNCNQSNTASQAAFTGGTGLPATAIRCIAHDNTSSNTSGFINIPNVISCISDTNGQYGFVIASNTNTMVNCDAYNNGSDGIRGNNGGTSELYIENCNLVKNGGWGINLAFGATSRADVVNCGFGAGTQVNASGSITAGSGSAVEAVGTVTYANDVTPWTDPANGDFRVNLAAATNAGRGAFTQTSASYTGTVSILDIGAAQAAAGGSSSVIGVVGS